MRLPPTVEVLVGSVQLLSDSDHNLTDTIAPGHARDKGFLVWGTLSEPTSTGELRHRPHAVLINCSAGPEAASNLRVL
jgi:hypothetical protein